MPAPLGKTPTKKMPRIDVYGLEDSQATRGAIRFFRERRVVVQFVDLRKKPLTLEDLRRFVDAVGLPALVDAEAGEAADDLRAGPLLARIRADPHVLRLPVVRYAKEVTTGKAEATWRAWLDRRLS